MNFPKVITEKNQVRYEFMDGSSIMVTPGVFEERTCEEDFLPDAEFVSPLFRQIHNLLEGYFMRRVKKAMPNEIYEYIEIMLFNEAYKLCSRIFEEGKDVCIPEIENIPYIEKDYIYALIRFIAYCIVTLISHFYNERLCVNVRFVLNVDRNLSHQLPFEFINHNGIALDPICFGKIRCKAKESGENRNVDSANHDTEDIERLKRQIHELESLLESERMENINLSEQLKNQEPKIVYKDKVVEVEKVVEKEVPLPDWVSLDDMSEYILNLRDDKEVQVMMNLFNYMLRKGLASKEKLSELIEKFEAQKLELQKPVVRQVNNFQSGSSYNDIHDNDNAKINTNGRR